MPRSPAGDTGLDRERRWLGFRWAIRITQAALVLAAVPFVNVDVVVLGSELSQKKYSNDHQRCSTVVRKSPNFLGVIQRSPREQGLTVVRLDQLEKTVSAGCWLFFA